MVDLVPVVSVPDIRDYERINAETVQLLDAGHRRIRLASVGHQRLLLSRLNGRWEAVVEVEGDAGPELAAEVDAPGLVVICRGGAADGAGRSLRAGTLLILGNAGDGVGYAQAGGQIIVAGSAGNRAGLNLTGGRLILLGPVGRLAGERQAGGTIHARPELTGPHAGRGRRGGRFLPIPAAGEDQEFDAAIAPFGMILPPSPPS